MSVMSSTADPVRIRIENTSSIDERAAIRAVNEAAFEGAYEADLVDQLRGSEYALISLVAELEERIVGTSCSAGCGLTHRLDAYLRSHSRL